MSNEPQDPLSRLLRRWADRRAPDEAEAERLRARVTAALRDAAFLDLPPVSPMRPRSSARARLAWFALGAAAAGLIAWLLPHAAVDRPTIAVREDAPEPLPTLARFQQSQLTEKARLLAGLEELFNGRLAWMAEDGRQVHLGLLADAVGAPRNAKPLAVRVVVLERRAGDEQWKRVWGADLVTHNEQLVELTSKGADGAVLRMWTQCLPDGMIAVDADLALDGDLPVRSSSSGIQQGGVPQRVFSLQSGDLEYQVYQTIATLPVRKSS
jgi:hypothetical protein